jgi:hypothetical protein
MTCAHFVFIEIGSFVALPTTVQVKVFPRSTELRKEAFEEHLKMLRSSNNLQSLF